jgi:hypothetical protein
MSLGTPLIIQDQFRTFRASLFIDFLIDGQIASFCPDQPEAEAFNPNNATQTHSIFVKL